MGQKRSADERLKEKQTEIERLKKVMDACSESIQGHAHASRRMGWNLDREISSDRKTIARCEKKIEKLTVEMARIMKPPEI